MAQAILRPNGAGDYSNLLLYGGGDSHWTEVDEVVADDFTTYVRTSTSGQLKDAYELEALPAASSVASVRVYFRHCSSGGTALRGWNQPFLRLDGVETVGTEVLSPFFSVSGWLDSNEVLARPGGGDWTPTDIANLQVCIGIRSPENEWVNLTQVYVVVDYTPDTPVSAAVSLGLDTSASRAVVATVSASVSMSLVPSVNFVAKNIGEFLIIASRDSGSIKTGSPTGASWSDCAKDASGGLAGAYLAQYLNRLCVINSQNTGFSYSAVNDIVSNWTEKASFPNYPLKFTDLFVGRDAGDDPALFFLTPKGMYYLDVFSNFVAGPTEVTWEYDSASGKVGFYGRGGQYIAVGKGIYNINKGEVILIGPDRDDGLPETLQGAITDMIQVGFWLVISIDGGTSNKSSILKRYITGNHWHTVYVGSVNTPIKTLFWDSGTLYFGEGTDVKTLPFSNATDNVAKLSTHTYCTSGDIIYPYFHSEFEAMPKVAHKVRGVTQDCDSDDKITIYYRTDSTTTWTELGSFITSPRPTALPFPASGDGIGVSFERIQFKASYAQGATTTNSPKLESLTLEYRVVPPVLWGWDFQVQAISSGDESGQDIIDKLKTAVETGTLMSFFPDGDKEGTEYFVEVSQMPGNESGTEFGTEGIYKVSVNEVID